MTRPLCVRRPPRPRGGCGGARPGRRFNCATLCPRESSAYLVSPGTTLSQRATLWRRRKRVAIRRLLITVQKVLYRVSERHAPQAQRATTEIIHRAVVWTRTHTHAHTFGFHTHLTWEVGTRPRTPRARTVPSCRSRASEIPFSPKTRVSFRCSCRLFCCAIQLRLSSVCESSLAGGSSSRRQLTKGPHCG